MADYREKYPTVEKKAEPITLILDSQSVKNAFTTTEQIGFDGGKLIKGRKRVVLIETSVATVATRVLPANAYHGQSTLAWWATLAHHPLLSQVAHLHRWGISRRICPTNGGILSNRGDRSATSGATGGQVLRARSPLGGRA